MTQDDEERANEFRGMILLNALMSLKMFSGSDEGEEEEEKEEFDLHEDNREASSVPDGAAESSSNPVIAPPASVLDEGTDEAIGKECNHGESTCEAAIILKYGILSGHMDILAWVENHRRATQADPSLHRSCHRLVWHAVTVLEGTLKESRNATTENEIISLVREVYYLSGPQQLSHRMATRKLIGLLRLRSLDNSSRFDLEEIVSIHRSILHRSDGANELENLGNLFHALGMLCNVHPEISRLEERAALARQALDMKPGDINHILHLTATLYALYERTSTFDHFCEFSALVVEKSQRSNRVDCAVMSGMEDQFQRTRQVDNLSNWLLLHRRMVTLAPSTHATCPERLVSLLEIFRSSAHSSQTDTVAIAQEAVRLTNMGIGVSHRLRTLVELARTLKAAHPSNHSDEVDRLNRQVYQLVRASSYHIRKLDCLPQNALAERFRSLSGKSKNGVENHSEAERLRLASLAFDAGAETMKDSIPVIRWVNPWRAAYLDITRPPNLMQDYEAALRSQLVSPADFEALPLNSPQRAYALMTYALTLLAANEPSKLDGAVALSYNSIRCWGLEPGAIISRDHPGWGAVRALGMALFMRYRWSGSLVDIQNSVTVFVRSGDEKVPDLQLGMALTELFRRLGQRVHISAAIFSFQQSLPDCPEGSDEQIFSLLGLGRALDSYYDFYGDTAVLDNAASSLRQGLRRCPTSHPLMPILLASLGAVLRKRYMMLRSFNDLRAALDLGNAAIRFSKSPEADVMVMLGESNLLLFEVRGGSETLEAAISLFRQVLSLREGTHMADALFWFGASLRQRYLLSSARTDLLTAIDHSRQALMAQTDSHHPRYPFWSAGLAAALLVQAKNDETSNTLDEAANLYEIATALVPKTHPGRAEVLAGFGETLYTRYEVRRNPSDLDQCLEVYKEAASSTTAPTFRCLQYTQTLRALAAKHQPLLVEAAFDASFQHKFRMANLGRTVQSRHEILSKLPIESSRAAAHAISEGKLERAVEVLERGRSIIWQQTLNLRSSMDTLSQVAPELATQLSTTITELDNNNRTQSLSYHSTVEWSITDPDRTARYHRELAAKYESLLADVRKLNGFEDFMQATTFADLDGIASDDGPVVLVNFCQNRCDALLLTSHGLRHVPLPDAVWADYEAAQEDLAIAANSLEESPSKETITYMDDVLLQTLRMLWKTTVDPILNELRSLGPMPQRMFWCMAGAIDMPIHAAGPYVHGSPNLPDIIVSSYTPTLMALVNARKSARVARADQTPAILAVAQTSTPGFSDLPGAKVEVDIVQQCSTIPVTRLVDDAATSDAVLAGLETHAWVHLCCHGTANARQPLLSAFHLSGCSLNIESLMRESRPAADFAFLGSCHTAMGSIAHNESMSLAVALQVVGFRSIVATMYAIDDRDSAVVAKEVYAYLFRNPGSPPTSSDAAVALNKAVSVLRRAGVPLFRWVPFIHIGL